MWALCPIRWQGVTKVKVHYHQWCPLLSKMGLQGHNGLRGEYLFIGSIHLFIIFLNYSPVKCTPLIIGNEVGNKTSTLVCSAITLFKRISCAVSRKQTPATHSFLLFHWVPHALLIRPPRCFFLSKSMGCTFAYFIKVIHKVQESSVFSSVSLFFWIKTPFVSWVSNKSKHAYSASEFLCNMGCNSKVHLNPLGRFP